MRQFAASFYYIPIPIDVNLPMHGIHHLAVKKNPVVWAGISNNFIIF